MWLKNRNNDEKIVFSVQRRLIHIQNNDVTDINNAQTMPPVSRDIFEYTCAINKFIKKQQKSII